MPADVTDLPDPGERGVPRYSRRPFPPYRYVPGRHPHPHRDPAGHSYQQQIVRDRHTPRPPHDWQDDWVYGIDLFNHFFFWEAHEAWEGVWTAAPRTTPASLLAQGLIQIAAALLKTHLQVLAGARRLSDEGIAKLRSAATGAPHLLGLDVREAADRFETYFAPLRHDVAPVIGPAVPVLRVRGRSDGAL